MKLISLNVEGMRHLNTVEELLTREAADVVCLMEANENHDHILTTQGYHTSFVPNIIENRDHEMLPEGCLVGTKTTHIADSMYYYKPNAEIVLANHGTNKRATYAQGLINLTTDIDGKTYTIVTTHFTWTPEGSTANEWQREDITSLLAITCNLPPHILVGDMNIPRDHNPLYDRFRKHYTDNIPSTYKSSLDKNLHRLGTDPEKQIMFTDYMVDYVFSQPPYQVSDVRLEFGVSDHAAVICSIAVT